MSEPERTFDITILGAGPGGYVAAIRAAQLGLRTAVVEMAPLPGGTCLHRGCIPTKALLRAAEVLEIARKAPAYGVKVLPAQLDLAATQRYKERVVLTNAKGVEYLLRKNGVTVLRGRGRLAGRGRVEVAPADGDPFVVSTRHTILATGSEIRGLPGIEFDGRRILHSDHALGLTEVPSSLAVLGAGAVGVEFASIFASFGAKVTIVEILPRLVPIEDAALGDELEKSFRKRGIESHVGTRVEGVIAGEKGVRIEASRDGRPVSIEAEALLVAVGRRPVTGDLGLEGTGVRLDRGFVETDGRMRTGEPGVYAIGDIVKTPALAHVASHEGIVAAEDAAGADPLPVDYDRIPSCTYCDPEVASVGLSEEEARRRGHDVAVGSFPFSAVGKARVLNDTRGFVKLVAERKHDRILGVHVVGPHATELIAEATAALSLDATVASLVHTVHAHPTLSEAIGEAALAAHGRSLHI